MSGNMVLPTDNPHTREKPGLAQYKGEIGEVLRQELEREATARRGTWIKRQLPSGTIVAFRYRTTRNEFNLSFVRDTAPDGLAAQAAWEAEVRLLQISLGARRWSRGDDLHIPEGGIAAAFVSR